MACRGRSVTGIPFLLLSQHMRRMSQIGGQLSPSSHVSLMQVDQAHATGPQKHKPGQPKGASLSVLQQAKDTLVDPSRIGVRMPGDPPR